MFNIRLFKLCFSETASSVGSTQTRSSEPVEREDSTLLSVSEDDQNLIETTTSESEDSDTESFVTAEFGPRSRRSSSEYDDASYDDYSSVSESSTSPILKSGDSFDSFRHSNPGRHFLDMPIDIHLEIKKYLDLKTTCQMRLVNRFCLEHYSKNDIWSSLSLKSDSSNYCLTKKLKKLEIFCQNQSRTELDRMHLILFQAIQVCTCLEELSIHGYFTPRGLTKTFKRVGKSLKNLSVYNVPSILHPKVLESMSDELVNLSNLHVSLSDGSNGSKNDSTSSKYYPRGNSLDIAGLRIAISKCERLRKFSISINSGIDFNRDRDRENFVEDHNQNLPVRASSPLDFRTEDLEEIDFDDIPLGTNFRDFLMEQEDGVPRNNGTGRNTQVVIERL